MTVATVLGLLLLVVTLGGRVWLDRGPVGRQGRELMRPRPPQDDDVPRSSVRRTDASR